MRIVPQMSPATCPGVLYISPYDDPQGTAIALYTRLPHPLCALRCHSYSCRLYSLREEGEELMRHHHIVLPPGAVTGIGSLPFYEPHAAIRFVAQSCSSIPFWPELPQCSPEARSVEQTFGAFADLVRPRLDSYGYEVVPGQLPALLERLEQSPACLEPTRSAGFFAFEQAMAAGRFRHALALKGQVIGPLTLAWQLFAAGRPLITQPAYLTALGHYLTRLAQWQIDRLAQWGKPVLLFLDEPCLALAPSPGDTTNDALVAVIHSMLAALRCPDVLLGVHTCALLPQGGVPIAALCQAQPDIISFDAHEGLEAFCADPAAQRFLRAGGRVAFGLVPTFSVLDQIDPDALFMRWLVAVTDVMSVGALARQTMITATCGLGLLSEPAAVSSFHLAHQLARRIAQVAEATP